MKPEEKKARELVYKFSVSTDLAESHFTYDLNDLWTGQKIKGKKRALFCIEEMLKELIDLTDKEHSDNFWYVEEKITKWQEVKSIIKNKL